MCGGKQHDAKEEFWSFPFKTEKICENHIPPKAQQKEQLPGGGG
jgi:hypothetical protein